MLARSIGVLTLAIALLGVSGGQANAQSRFELQGPSSMILGKDKSASIMFRGDEDTQLYASVGTITQSHRNGTRAAKFVAPKTRFPQVAIIAAATSDLSNVEFITIQLLGQPTLRIASEPKAQVTVRVADATFGPIKVNRKGLGSLRVLVPPGVKAATIHASDRFGNKTTTPHPLGVPAFTQVLAICPQGSDDLITIAVDASGNPAKRPRFSMQASLGRLAPPTKRSPGVFAARFQVGNIVLDGDTASISVALAGKPKNSSRCSAKIPRESPMLMRVAIDGERFTAGSDVPRIISVQFSYPGKRLPRREAPDIVVTIGALGPPTILPDGSYQFAWDLPNNFSGMNEARATVQLPDSNLREETRVNLQSGPIARIALGGATTGLVASPSNTRRIPIRAYDNFGNEASPEHVAVSAAHGTIERSSGAPTATYRPPLRYSADVDTITARTPSGYEQSLVMELKPASRTYLIGARAGFVTNLGTISTLALAADAMYLVPLGSHRVELGVETGYYKNDDTMVRVDGEETVTTTLSVIPILLRGTYARSLGPIMGYGGGGGGVLLARAQVQSERSGMRSENAYRPALTGLVGARTRLGRGLAVLEASYWQARFDEPGISGRIGGWRLTGGYGVDL